VSNATADKNELFFDPDVWADSKSWPYEPPGYVFLARAFQEIGRAKFGGEWVDAEEDIVDPEDPTQDDIDVWDRFDSFCDQLEAEFFETHASVALLIIRACQEGALDSALRPEKGGQASKLETHFWHGESLLYRFSACQMSRHEPFSISYPSNDASWIYLTRDSVDRYLKTRLENEIESAANPSNGLRNEARTKAIFPNTADQTTGVRKASGSGQRRLRVAVVRAIAELTNSGIQVASAPIKMQNDMIVKQLVKEGILDANRGKVSYSTIKRALEEFAP
jgi:hypothetical protein